MRSAAPGFAIGNVYVMAGVPRIMQAMFDGIKHTLKGGAKVLSKAVTLHIGEVRHHFGQGRRHAHVGADPGVSPLTMGTRTVLPHSVQEPS